MSVVAALLAVRLLGHPALSADDVFFLDAGRHVTEEGRLAMGLWGNALGHETLLASYPPLMPLVSALNVWAIEAAGTVLVAKVTDLALCLIAGIMLWKSLGFIRRPWLRAVLTVAVMLDPLSMTFFSTIRPEALLMPLVFVLCVATERVLDGDKSSASTVIVTGALLAMTHWQFLPTVAYVAVVLLAGAYRGSVARRTAVAYVLAIAALYGAWAAYVTAAPARLEAVRMQLLDAPGSTTSWQMIKMLVGTVVAGNLEQGSAASLFLLLAAGILVLEWSRRVERPVSVSARSAPFLLGYLAVAVLPALLLGYVGPRAAPLYLVTAWVVIRRAAGPAARALATLAPVVAAANVAGDLLLRTGYLHQSGAQAWLQVSWLWLGVACAVALLARRGRTATAGALVVASLLALGAVTVGRPQGARDLPVTDENVQLMAAALQPAVRSSARVLCDAPSHYLALQSLGVREVFDVFPLFYFPAPKSSRILADMQPDIVLATDRLLPVPASGAAPVGQLADFLRDHFEVAGAFEVAGRRTVIYTRRP